MSATIHRAGIFWTGTRTLLSIGIRWFTRHGNGPGLAKVSHCGLIFDAADGHTVIHEALLSEGYCEKSAAKLQTFDAKAKGNTVIIEWLPLVAADAQRLYNESRKHIGKDSYAADQIIAFMLCRSLLGRVLRLTVSDAPGRVVCSEIVARLLAPFGFDLRDTPNESFDSVTPAELLEQYRKKYT